MQSHDSSSSLNLGDRSSMVRLTWFGTASWFSVGDSFLGDFNVHCRKHIHWQGLSENLKNMSWDTPASPIDAKNRIGFFCTIFLGSAWTCCR